MSFTITGTLLKSIAPSLDISRANSLADSLNKITEVYDMNTIEVLPSFIAQLAHESIEFKAKAENMNYSAEAILKTWPKRFKTLEEAQPFARNPQALANKVYNGRMGNAADSDDGWNFRGSGFMQMTGKDAFLPYFDFKKAGKGFPLPEAPETIEEVVELIRTNDDWAIDSACWEFAICKDCIPKATAKDFLGITKAINGGTIGLDSRELYYKKALEVIA
ncbi:MAG: glycoside hydrolase family 19 protein [Segetibacter sp.]|nr:glycoside hydrolase family 19 protein [Segetibacter sp.]